jgi:hypothetical protein
MNVGRCRTLFDLLAKCPHLRIKYHGSEHRYVNLTYQCLHLLDERCLEVFEERLRGVFFYPPTPPVPCQDAQLEGEFHTSSKGIARHPLTRTQQTRAQNVVHHNGMRICQLEHVRERVWRKTKQKGIHVTTYGDVGNVGDERRDE